MIIITGATGFVGRRLIKLLVKTYDKKNILCLIKNKNDGLENEGRQLLRKLKVKTKYIDLVSREGLKNLPKIPEIIINLAATTDTAVADHRCNDIGVMNLVHAIGPLDSNTHFIHMGTMVAMSGRIKCTKPFTANDRLVPTNEYTRSKTRGEKYLIKKNKNDKFRLSILRPNTIYGKGMRPNSLFDFLKELIIKRSIFSRLNWPGLSSLVHVDDVAGSIASVTKKLPKPGVEKVYLLHGEHLTLAQMSRLVHKATRTTYNPVKLPKIFWSICKIGRHFIPLLEKITNLHTYNPLWRAGLIVDNVIYCKTGDLKQLLHREPKRLKNHVLEVLT